MQLRICKCEFFSFLIYFYTYLNFLIKRDVEETSVKKNFTTDLMKSLDSLKKTDIALNFFFEKVNY